MIKNRISLKIESRLEHIRFLTAGFRGVCQELAIAEAMTAQLELALTEAVNNVIEHAYAMEAGHPVLLDIAYDDKAKEVTLIVTDHGQTAPESLPLDTGLPDPDSLPEGGWGLNIIQHFVDQYICSQVDGNNQQKLVKKVNA